MNVDKIPPELKCKDDIWVAWKYIKDEKGKDSKLPVNPKTGKAASISDPETWGSFDKAVERQEADGLDGVEIALRKNGKIVLTGLDFDHCIDADGISPWAWEVIKTIDSYTEKSPSGTGIRVIVNTDGLPPGGRKNGDVEIYDDRHFLSITGDHIEGTPDWIGYRPKEVVSVWERFIGSNGRNPHEVTEREPLLTDDEIIEKLSKAKNSEKFNKLNSGQWQYLYQSQSEADLAFCNQIAFYSQNVEQIDRIVRKSGLYRQKWDSKRNDSTYGRDTILSALANTAEVYALVATEHRGSSSVNINKSSYIYRGVNNEGAKVGKNGEGGGKQSQGAENQFSNSGNLEPNANKDNIANNDNKNETLLTSANNANKDSRRDLLLEVDQWVGLARGIFKTQDVINELDIRTREEKLHLYVILGRLCEKGVIEQEGSHRGTYRRVEKKPQVQNWKNSTGGILGVKFPLDIHEKAKIQRGNIILLEGGKSQGKTTFALEFCRLNRGLYPNERICYQNLEMADDEIKLKLSSYPSEVITEDEWDEAVEFIKVSSGWQDFVNPRGINVIDYLVNYEKAYLIAQDILNIHSKLQQGIALVLVQRDPLKPYANGGGSIRNIPRLCLSILNHVIKLEDVKSWAAGVKINPTGLQRQYKQVEWWKLVSYDEWTY